MVKLEKILNFFKLSTLKRTENARAAAFDLKLAIDCELRRVNTFLEQNKLDPSNKIKPSDIDRTCIRLKKSIERSSDPVETLQMIQELTCRVRELDVKPNLNYNKYLEDILDTKSLSPKFTISYFVKPYETELIKPWVLELHAKDQCALLSALRGCDVENDNLKQILRSFRYDVVNFIPSRSNVENKPLENKGSDFDNIYSSIKVYKPSEVAWCLSIIGNIYSEHWTSHFLHAIKIIKKYHPNAITRRYWKSVHTEFMDVSKNKLPGYISRLVFETIELETKVNNLTKFISKGSELVDDLHKQQLKLMTDYLAILHVRLDKANINYPLIRDYDIKGHEYGK